MTGKLLTRVGALRNCEKSQLVTRSFLLLFDSEGLVRKNRPGSLGPSPIAGTGRFRADFDRKGSLGEPRGVTNPIRRRFVAFGGRVEGFPPLGPESRGFQGGVAVRGK